MEGTVVSHDVIYIGYRIEFIFISQHKYDSLWALMI